MTLEGVAVQNEVHSQKSALASEIPDFKRMSQDILNLLGSERRKKKGQMKPC